MSPQANPIARTSLSIEETSSPLTLMIDADIYVEINTLENAPGMAALCKQFGFMEYTPGDELLHVGEIALATGFHDPRSTSTMSDTAFVSDLVARFADEMFFDPRTPAIAGMILPLMARPETMPSAPMISATSIISNLRICPGLDSLPLFDSALKALSCLMWSSPYSMLFIHSEVDRHDSREGLWNAMARHNTFRRNYPDWQITTFPKTEPAMGTIAGLIPGMMTPAEAKIA